MKKLLVCFICLMLMFTFTGCTQGPIKPSFTNRKPWQFIETSRSNSEFIEYDAYRYSYNGLNPTEQAKGELSFMLKESGDNTELLTDSFLTFNEASDYNNKTNSITSKVVFNCNSLLPISSTKTLTINASSSEKGYTASTNYSEKKSTVTLLDGTSKEFNLKDSEYFDNEQLYYLVRSIPDITAGASYTFNIITPYDMYTNEKFFAHKIKVSVTASLTKLVVPKDIYDMSIARSGEDSGKLSDAGEYSIDCIQIEASLAAKKSGPSIKMFLSDLSFIDNAEIRAKESSHTISYTSKVPVKIIVTEYNVNSSLASTNEYNIKSYSTL